MNITRTLLRWLIVIFALIAIIFIIMLTPFGLKLSLDLTKKIIPGHLQYQSVSGIITGPINIKNFQYDHEGTRIAIKKFEMNWRPITLLWGKLTITKLRAKQVYLTLGAHKQSTQPGISVPYKIEISNATLHDVAIGHHPNQYPTIIKRAYLNATIVPHQIAVQGSAKFLKPFPVTARLFATGNFSKYKLSLTLKSPHLNWRIYGSGNDRNIQLTTQEAHTLGGRLSGKMDLQWLPHLRWNIDLNAKQLNFNELQRDWPKQLSIQLKTQGKIEKEKPKFALNTVITAPQAKVKLTAKKSKILHLQWQAAITKLSSLLPDARGSLYSTGSWTGNFAHPSTKGTIKARDFALFSYQAKRFSGNWNLFPSSGQPSSFNVDTTQFKTTGIYIPSLQLRGKGSLHSHELIGNFGRRNANVILHLQGGLFNKQWRGKLDKFSIVSSRFANWQMAKPTGLNISSSQAKIPQLCLRSSSNHSQLCIHGEWNRDKPWSFDMRGKQFDPSLLTNLFLPKLSVFGKTQFQATVRGFGNKVQNASGKLDLNAGRFIYDLNGNSIASPLQSMRIRFNFDKSGIRSNMNAILSSNNSIDIALSMPSLDDTAKDQKIRGHLRSHLSNLHLFSKIVPDIIKATGALHANMTIRGTRNHPELSGQIDFLRGSLKLARLGIALTNMNIDLSIRNNAAHYKAVAYSGKSPIKLEGKSQWIPRGLKSDITVSANNALILNNPEYTIYASPNLHLQVINKNIDMQGTITIPKGIIQPKEFTNTVSLPLDQIVYIGKPPVKTAHGWQVISDITVKLGKDVTVNSSGLNATLSGQATLKGSPEKTTIANGRIKIVKGKFSAYGKTLVIIPGSYIQFVNSPAANPNLNIRATKKIAVNTLAATQQLGLNDITVGVYVTGTARRPKIRLFSIPSNLSQADILSYLILGYATNLNSSANIDLLLEAASALKLGGSGTGGVVSQIKQGLGLTELGIESETLVDAIGTPIDQQSAFVIGKHLTRRIYIRYSLGLGQGPFAPVNIFQLRYRLGKNWTLQTDSSSLGNGVDILYTMSH